MTTASVEPEEIVRQRALGWPDFHPETYCHRCGHLNVPSWWVDSDEWNKATGDTVREALSILCPPCFVQLWERATGLTVSWRLSIDPSTLTEPRQARPIRTAPLYRRRKK